MTLFIFGFVQDHEVCIEHILVETKEAAFETFCKTQGVGLVIDDPDEWLFQNEVNVFEINMERLYEDWYNRTQTR